MECERLLGEYRVREMIFDECQIRGNVSRHVYDAVNDLQRGIEGIRLSRNRLRVSRNDHTPDEVYVENLLALPKPAWMQSAGLRL